jgi:hypothetical protein
MAQPETAWNVSALAHAEVRMIERRSASALFLAAMLASCGQEPTASNQTNMTAAEADIALDAAMNAVKGGNEGTLVPPAPGEPGGLPDDRTPLNESAARVPTSVEASGATLERWGLALGAGRFGEAYRLWRDNGRQSGMNEAQFTESWRKYSEIHVLIGRPQAGGTQTARVPLQVYGREREGSKPFNLIGMTTLARNPAGQNGEAGQIPWVIAAMDLVPRGTVKIVPPEGESMAERIPAAFQGRWSQSDASCKRPGDDMRLAVSGNTLTFYESVGKVTALEELSKDRIQVAAAYSGEGSNWAENSTLALSDNGKVLTIDGVRRVRCA